MHELSHLIGICADSHSHYDLIDALAYMGLTEISLQLNWVKFTIKAWLGI